MELIKHSRLTAICNNVPLTEHSQLKLLFQLHNYFFIVPPFIIFNINTFLFSSSHSLSIEIVVSVDIRNLMLHFSNNHYSKHAKML